MNATQARALGRIADQAMPLFPLFYEPGDLIPGVSIETEGYDDDILEISLHCYSDTLVRYPRQLGIRLDGRLVTWDDDAYAWIPCRLRWRYGNLHPCANRRYHRERYFRICEAVYWTAS